MTWMFTGACAVTEEEANHPLQITDTEPWLGELQVLRASRTYAPSRWEDGQLTLQEPIHFTIPSAVPVVMGNGGNHWVEFRFRTAQGEEQNCDYRAGSDKAHPETGVEQAKGRRYLFVRCSGGLKEGDRASALSFQLHIRNGDHKDPAEVTRVELRLGGNLPELSPPIPPEESAAIRDSFSWDKTIALPERNPEGLPSLYYSLVYVEEREQIDALDEMLVHYSTLPLFGEELERWQGQRGVFSHEGDGHGMFLFALMPAATYNLLREAALNGNAVYSVIALRNVPASVKLADGSISYEALRSSGFLYRGLQPTDVASWSLTSPGSKQVKQELFNRIIRAIVKTVATVVKAEVRLVVRGIGLIDRWAKGSVTLRVRLDLQNMDPAFPAGPMQRAWGAGAGTQVPLSRVRISAWQKSLGVLPTLFTDKADDGGMASMRVARGKKTSLCVATENDAVEVTKFLLESEICDFTDTLSDAVMEQDVERLIPVERQRSLNVLAQASEGWSYMKDVVGYEPHKARVLVGGLANIAGLASGNRAFAPCFHFPNLSEDVFIYSSSWATFVDGITLKNLGAGMVARRAASAYLTDIIIPEDPSESVAGSDSSLDSRGVASHEYGHFVLCSMLYSENPANISFAYTAAMLDQILSGGSPTGEMESAYHNESFADFVASQLVGGVNYFDPCSNNPSRSQPECESGAVTTTSLGVNYCNAASKDCLEHNFSGQGSFVGGNGFDAEIARVTTLLHDAFDGRDSLTSGNAPSNADVWKLNGSDQLVYSSQLRAGSSGDENVALPGRSLRRLIANWAKRGVTLNQSNVMGALADTMREEGVNWCEICQVFALHDENFDPNTMDPRDVCTQAPIRNWIGPPPPNGCGGTATAAGMTWRVRQVNGPYVLVGSDGQTDPYNGDTAPTAALPILCLSRDGRPVPSGLPIDFYNGWAAGVVQLTQPILGSALTSRATADGFCSSAFGSGYRMAEFHDGGGGWNWWAEGAPDAATRFWVAINDQPANPWDP
ncbi:hypothetical protein JYK02_28955 [Corallococcus macrosporus]|uniref:Peptidase M43 pregnancy-associated plasma-A domain-containing protein n=1 Tax=Corallococcus macrosporus TaxID=35 RepID=A0ABS3DJP7_9BACT|nr:hypothetical protein [Corallococcus macrosporus]MBN8231549.1 hypothetical protein [Corallococcus macrosporus]